MHISGTDVLQGTVYLKIFEFCQQIREDIHHKTTRIGGLNTARSQVRKEYSGIKFIIAELKMGMKMGTEYNENE